jgi:hypothetical protein
MLLNIIISKLTLISTVFDKDIIKKEVGPYLPLEKRGFQTTIPLEEIVNAILYKLKAGVQWYQLPLKAVIVKIVLSWYCVYYRYRRWFVSNVL